MPYHLPAQLRSQPRAVLAALLVALLAVILVVATAVFAGSPGTGPAAAVPRGATATDEPEGSERPEASESPDASEAPEESEAAEGAETGEGSPSAAEVSRVVGRLADAGITTTAADFQALAAKVGVGGAVRVLSFAHASGKTPAQILAMFQGGMGWGQIDRQLHLSIGPGIGWIMGHGHKGGSH